MITFTELMHGHVITDLSTSDQHNLEDLQTRVNIVATAWGKPMIVTSGYRSMQDHLRIYHQKGITDTSKIPMHSKHLIGCAVDISDPHLELTAWLKTAEGEKVLEEADLYCEEGNSTWTHLQSKSFGSYKPGGTRWFKP